MMYLRFIATAAAASFMQSAVAQATYIPLGDLPGGNFLSVGSAISGDGRIAVGHSTDGGGISGSNAFRWTLQSGMSSLGRPDGTTGTSGISTNGQYIVGSINAVPGVTGVRGAFWSASGEFHTMGDLPGGTEFSIAGDVSDTGVAVGASSYADGPFGPLFQATRWTVGGGLEPLGFLNDGDVSSWAVDINADGSVIGGWGTSGNWFWTESEGMTPAAPLEFELRSMTGNGMFMLGKQNIVIDGQNQLQAVAWSEKTGTIELDRSDFSDGALISIAIDATANAETIVGRISGLSLRNTPYIWFDQGAWGMTLQEYMLDNGLDFSTTGYRMTDIAAMSDDGTRFLVNTFNPHGRPEAVLVIVPAPASTILLGVGLLATRRRR